MCKREDLSLLDMHEMLDETYTSFEKVVHVSQKKTIIKALNRANVRMFDTLVRSTRKQPRVNVLSRHVPQDMDLTGTLFMFNYTWMRFIFYLVFYIACF